MYFSVNGVNPNWFDDILIISDYAQWQIKWVNFFNCRHWLCLLPMFSFSTNGTIHPVLQARFLKDPWCPLSPCSSNPVNSNPCEFSIPKLCDQPLLSVLLIFSQVNLFLHQLPKPLPQVTSSLGCCSGSLATLSFTSKLVCMSSDQNLFSQGWVSLVLTFQFSV